MTTILCFVKKKGERLTEEVAFTASPFGVIRITKMQNVQICLWATGDIAQSGTVGRALAAIFTVSMSTGRSAGIDLIRKLSRGLMCLFRSYGRC